VRHIITHGAIQTKDLASRFARRLLKSKPAEKALVVGLIGELGGGKTVFAKGFAKSLGIGKIITSPTFVLEKNYELPGKKHLRLIHIDAYRIENPEELIGLGFKNLIRDPKNIVLVEWADKVSQILPKDCVRIKFEHAGKNKRKITIKTFDS